MKKNITRIILFCLSFFLFTNITKLFCMNQAYESSQLSYSDKEFNKILHTIKVWIAQENAKEKKQSTVNKNNGEDDQIINFMQSWLSNDNNQYAFNIPTTSNVQTAHTVTTNIPNYSPIISHNNQTLGNLFNQNHTIIEHLRLTNPSTSTNNITPVVDFLPESNTLLTALTLNKFTFHSLLLIRLLTILKTLKKLSCKECAIAGINADSFTKTIKNPLILEQIKITPHNTITNSQFLFSFPSLQAFLSKCPLLKSIKIKTLLINDLNELCNFLVWVQQLCKTTSSINFEIYTSADFANCIQRDKNNLSNIIQNFLNDPLYETHLKIFPIQKNVVFSKQFSIKICLKTPITNN